MFYIYCDRLSVELQSLLGCLNLEYAPLLMCEVCRDCVIVWFEDCHIRVPKSARDHKTLLNAYYAEIETSEYCLKNERTA